MSNTYFKAISVIGCEIGGITRRSLCRHNCCDGENCVTWLEKQFAKLNEYEEAKADGRLVERGTWINGYCSNCNSPIPTDNKDDYIAKNECRFCYYCGAKMEEAAEKALVEGKEVE